jgi:hypothetical protein
MEPGRIERFAPLAGVLAIAVIAAAFIVFPEEFPDTDDSLADIVKFWRDHDSEASLSAALFALGAVPYMWFAGSLRARLRAAEPAPGRLSALSFAGAILFTAAVAIGASLQFVLGEAVKDLSPAAIQTLNALNAQFFFTYAVGLGVFMLANAMAIIRYRGLHVAFGWTALILGIVAVTPAGFFAFLASGLWVLVASIYLYLRPVAPPAAAPPTAPATSPGSPS